MKKILLLTIPLILIASNTKINNKIISLEHELKSLKEQVNNNSEDINSNLPILESTEKKSILDKINFSPELLLRVDKFDYKNGIIGNTPQDEPTLIYNHDGSATGLQRRDEFSKHYRESTSIRFRLNMSMNLNDLKFYGRLLYMNSSQSNQRICILSRNIKTGTAGSAFDVDRAYIDYTPNKKSEYAFTLSFGILPTTGGTPMQFAQNRQRSSLFPALVFDMNTYGFIATQKLGKNSFARVVLAKAYTLRPNFYPYQCNRENIDNADVAGVYFDSKFNFLGKSLLSFGVNTLHDFKAHPYLGPDVSATDASILGTIVTYGLGLDIQKVAQTNTTLFAHTAISNPHGNGAKDDYKIVDKVNGKTADGRAGFTEADYASGSMLNSNGYSVYLGAKYDINKAFNIGAEYNHGSKYWFSATEGAEDMYNKLALRGDAYEIYGVWKFHKYLNAKIGYLSMHENYTGSGWHFGDPYKKDATQSIAYLSLEARF